jgi:alanine racemase
VSARDLVVIPDANPRAQAQVDLDAISANVRLLDARSPGAQVMAVVKADGYGHGLLPSAQAALDGGATWLGVALPEEALALRAAGISAPVLSWLLPIHDQQLWTDLARANVDVSVSDLHGLENAAKAAAEAGGAVSVHLKADTGLGRGGAPRATWSELLNAAASHQASGALRIIGIWSHLAFADEPDHPVVRDQIDVFTAALDDAKNVGITPDVRHLANSGATLMNTSAHFDLVRPGIAVYGLSPGAGVGKPADHGLRPAMTLKARAMLVKRLPAGHGISYAHQYVTTRDTTVVVVPLGYADGIPRHATNVGPLQINGERFRIAGRVCMDQVVVDVGDLPVDDAVEVVLFGSGDHGEPTADDWADVTGTIGYEIVTRIGPRVPRTYLDGPTVAAPGAGA